MRRQFKHPADASADAHALACVNMPSADDLERARAEGRLAAQDGVRDINAACYYPFGGLMAAAFREAFDAEWERRA